MTARPPRAPADTGSFDLYVGIDYSGAATAETPLPGLQVYAAFPGALPQPVTPPDAAGKSRHWSRRGLALWLAERVAAGQRLLVGMDHGFSFPRTYFDRYGLEDWPDFLDDFIRHWPTHEVDCRVEQIRDGSWWQAHPRPSGERVGSARDYRLCERWTSSAKSVFHFDVQGSVAKSTHAGLPWLRECRAAAAGSLQVWPFDGWAAIPGTSLIAEVYPSIFRNRYPREGRTADAQDAYAVARWLEETQHLGTLGHYLSPPLNAAAKAQAALEGWILGIT